MAVPTRAELNALICGRLAEDPAFRERLVQDPRAAVSEVLGVDLPDVVTVSVHARGGLWGCPRRPARVYQ